MNGKQITIPLDGYLRDWAVHQYGHPLSFPARSYENAILARYLTNRPCPSTPNGPVVTVSLPRVRGKDAACYIHISRKGVSILTEALDIIFRLDMWHSLPSLLTQGDVNESIRKWCLSRGIDDDHVEAVRQKFYRARRDYAQYGIILGKKYTTRK